MVLTFKSILRRYGFKIVLQEVDMKSSMRLINADRADFKLNTDLWSKNAGGTIDLQDCLIH